MEKRKYTKPLKWGDSRKMTDQEWLATRFWPKVQKTDGCWEWQACLDPKGYGRVIYKGKKYKPHRIIKAMESGLDVDEIPVKLQACHHCDNRKCVNPSHIFWGSNLDNVRDMVKKGRHGKFGRA
jgi:HNH endonuclease